VSTITTPKIEPTLILKLGVPLVEDYLNDNFVVIIRSENNINTIKRLKNLELTDETNKHLLDICNNGIIDVVRENNGNKDFLLAMTNCCGEFKLAFYDLIENLDKYKGYKFYPYTTKINYEMEDNAKLPNIIATTRIHPKEYLECLEPINIKNNKEENNNGKCTNTSDVIR
jgi:hypothetical protein